MASHGSDTNKVHLFMSFPSFFFLCLSVCLSVFLPVLQHRSFINEFSFVLLSFLYVCLSNKGHLIMSFSFFSVCVPVCLSNKGPLLMSFSSFFFLFCLCMCLSVCLSNKGHLLMIFPSFCSARCVCVCGWGGGGYSHIRAVRVCAARKPPIGLPTVCVCGGGGGGTPILGQYGYVPPESPPFFGLGRS